MNAEFSHIYSSQVRKYPLLSAEQEIVLADQIAAGSIEARNKLVHSNLRLVITIAKRFSSSSVPFMDLIQEGNLGLMAAASKYRSTFNTRFSTYAYPWILQYMLRYLHSKVEMIHIPNKKREMIRAVNDAKNYLMQQRGTEPSPADIAAYLSVSEQSVKTVLDFPLCVSSIDSVCGDTEGLTLGDMIVDTGESPEDTVMYKERNHELHCLMKKLPVPEMNVLFHRYNFTNERKPKTLREISDLLGVSAETVRQIEIRAIHRMRKEANAQGSGELFLSV